MKRVRNLISLKESFNRADVTAILPWQENLYEQVVAESILEHIDSGTPVKEVKSLYPGIDQHTVDYLLDKAAKLDIRQIDKFSRQVRIYSYLWKLTGENIYGDKCFGTICDATLKAAMESTEYDKTFRLKRMWL